MGMIFLIAAGMPMATVSPFRSSVRPIYFSLVSRVSIHP
jgi:hypothetical protein